jgi:hypothetical protein
MLDTMGVEAFTELASHEPRATGEAVRNAPSRPARSRTARREVVAPARSSTLATR